MDRTGRASGRGELYSQAKYELIHDAVVEACDARVLAMLSKTAFSKTRLFKKTLNFGVVPRIIPAALRQLAKVFKWTI